MNREPDAIGLDAADQDTVPRVRIAAIKSMAKIDDRRAIPLLKQGLHDEMISSATAGGAL